MSRQIIAKALVGLLLVTACAQPGNFGAPSQSFAPAQYYPPPGPPSDPWGPYIREAASRYSVPEQWIRAVMAQESGGQEQAVSPAGAMGLMQVMPDTYEDLREANGLGADPFNPEDNILAGTAYIRQMYDRYGAPGFLAAYNAGPQAVDNYLAGNGQLPDETVNYLTAVTPNLGAGTQMTGPLAAYVASGGVETAALTPTAASFAAGCEVNAAYDPDHPCAAAAPVMGATQVAAAGVCDANTAYNPDAPCSAAASGAAGVCDTNAAYDPDSPCTPANESAPAQVAEAGPETGTASAIYQPSAPAPSAPTPAPAPAGGNWAIQVGAFANPGLARAVAEGARAEAPADLAAATIALPATTPFGGLVLYRARLTNLSASAAANACMALNGRQLPCIVVPGSST
jgi:hypothetical protein